MKRMVKNGDLLDISEDGSGAAFGGNLKIGGTIIANGEIRGGDVSASKFYLGTEEMPLVKANPAGEATETLEKVKIGNVAYKVGGGSGDRTLKLVFPYSKNSTVSNKSLTIEDNDVWDKLNSYYYESIIVYYNDGYPLGVFNVLHYYDKGGSFQTRYAILVKQHLASNSSEWYGSRAVYYYVIELVFTEKDGNKKVSYNTTQTMTSNVLEKSKFDALYKLADKPTQDGTYVLKATVSGGAVTYTWVTQ